ncbi:MAG: hypothetical protein AB8H47_29435 [Bacteroidia bacterium]
MKHTLLFWGAFFCFLSPLLGQKIKVLNSFISTDSLAFSAIDNKDGHWQVQLWVKNQSDENVSIEAAEEIEHSYREILVGNTSPLKAGETRQIKLWVPIDYETEGQDRQITLIDDYEEVVGNFRLQTEVPRPTFSKRPSGWTSIRENQIYPLRVTLGNSIDQPMLLDSLVWDSAATDSSLRFKRWAISPELPEKIVPAGKSEIKVKIWTKGLYATIAGEFLLYYHLADGTKGVLPFAHAFGVEPNVWVEEGGQWDVGSIPYGQKIKRNFWITHAGAECITLVPEYESLVSLQDTTICPGDTTYGVVQYPTICDSVGNLDIEIALFVKEFSGHVPLRFRGKLVGEQTPPGQWLMIKDSIEDLGTLRLSDRKANLSIKIHNNGPTPLQIDHAGFSEYLNYSGHIGHNLAVKLSASSIPVGGSIKADLGIKFPYAPPSEIINYFNISATTEGCPAFSVSQSVKVMAKLKR